MNRLVLVVLLMLYLGKAMACSCAFHEGTLEEAVMDAYQGAVVVVLATAERIERLEPREGDAWNQELGAHRRTYHDRQKTHFVTKQTWKGDHGPTFTTDIVTACCLCGYVFREGQTYLLYLYGPNEDGYFSTSTCSRTKIASDDIDKELEILDLIHQK
ncbi:hypothetical protein FM042_00845 [Aliidiomarina halalkaliphila]|uniref:Uncharacterized protein n=1 Tax=Aliidiomarina halalkaliphila TaxID=2593535 RepID=A0A552X329_9GAMM|nr:hypothetical protein [Aliidiomarina halalkaliphila]TRW49444.1 hypothetical protein FM042_00845 [Aliidiomarina halalkaliphila]